MISDSTTLLPIILEQRFGTHWYENWQRLEDSEARWLAIHLAIEAANGRELGGTKVLARIINDGRAQLPVAAQSSRSIATLLAALHQARLLPPQASVGINLLADCPRADTGGTAQA
jgi:hypothetical protein